MNHRRLLPSGLITLALGLTLSTSALATGECTENTDHGLKLMTWNLQFKPGVAAVQFPQDTEKDRAADIGAAVRAHGPDVIVFNEVFTDAARDVLVSELGTEYPFYVSEIDTSWDELQDSGLMLFSRHPIVDLFGTDFQADDGDVETSILVPHDNVASIDFEAWAQDYVDGGCDGAPELCDAFHKLDDALPLASVKPGASGDDDHATKGAAMVSLEHACSGRRMHVAFTHLQASYDDDDPDSARLRVLNRAFQLQGIQRMIEHSVGEVGLTEEVVYFAGDLNLDGAWTPGKTLGPAVDEKLTEWAYWFDDASSLDDPEHGFFACGGQADCAPFDSSLLIDTWQFHTSPDDEGYTVGDMFQFTDPAVSKRIDYLLRSDAAPDPDLKTCSQHLTLAWPVAGPGGTWSDHLPVHGDFNLWAPQCSPLDAQSVALTAVQQDASYPGVITHPGSMQWFWLDAAPGSTWSLNVPQGYAYDVYRPTDLSRPLQPYENVQTDWGDLWVMEGDAYVRVYAVDSEGNPDRSATGTYDFDVHRHDCKFVDDACVLAPALPWSGIFPANPNPETQLFYRFWTEAASSGEYPTLTFRTERDPGDTATYTPQVRLVGSLKEVEGGASWYDGLSQDVLLSEWTGLDGTETGRAEYLLTVERDGPIQDEPLEVELRTDLTYLALNNLRCTNQQDNTAFSDDISIRSEVDGEPGLLGGMFFWVGEFDTKTMIAVPELAGLDAKGRPLRYLESADVFIHEDDDTSADEILEYFGPDYGTLKPLGVELRSHSAKLKFADADESYKYWLTYDRSHEPL